MPVGEGVELMHEPLGMDPAQAVAADIELAAIVADDGGVGEQPVRLDAAPERPLGRDQPRIGRDLEGGDAEPVKMGPPCRLVGEVLVSCSANSRMTGPASDRRPI